ncbi:MAG: DUF115 domain-containing protein [Deltaproteobacteria bacterium]|nr:DUF115 domain-containing protein [Deltaproteobacteria bacterium]
MAEERLANKDMWFANIACNQGLVKEYNLESCAVEYTDRHEYREYLREMPLMTYIRIFRSMWREHNIRKANKTRDKCIVVGAGPSAGEAVTFLSSAKRQGWKIIAVDRARPLLMDHGVLPDFTVTLDGQDFVADWFDDLHEEETIMASLQTHPALIKKIHKSPAKLLMYSATGPGGYSEYIKEKLGEDMLHVHASITVMPTAIFFAFKMGFKTVVTIGTELGWKSKEAILDEWYQNMAYETKDGWWTIKPFEDAADGFDNLAKNVFMSNEFYKDKKIYHEKVLIDSSGGLDKGYPYMPLDEVLKKY